jgi:hypothetical protein
VGLIAVLYSTGLTKLTGFIAFSVSPALREKGEKKILKILACRGVALAKTGKSCLPS